MLPYDRFRLCLREYLWKHRVENLHNLLSPPLLPGLRHTIQQDCLDQAMQREGAGLRLPLHQREAPQRCQYIIEAREIGNHRSKKGAEMLGPGEQEFFRDRVGREECTAAQ